MIVDSLPAMPPAIRVMALAMVSFSLFACSNGPSEYLAKDIGLVDTYVRSSVPDHSWGKEERLIVGGWGDVYQAFVTFDAKSLPEIGPGDKVVLMLYNVSSGGKEVPSPMAVTGILDGFSGETNYNSALGIRLGALRNVNPSAYGFWTEIDVTPEYQALRTGNEVKGIALIPEKDIGADQFNSFHSSESGDVEHRPRLRIIRAPA